MENRKYIKLLIPILLLGFFVTYDNALAYEVDTHAYLTSEIVNFYNKNFNDNQISTGLTSYLLDGSRREDDIPRWMNHFYDPVYNRGLSYDPKIDPVYNLGTWQKSKDWAQDDNNQNSLVYKVPATIASVLTALEQGKISAITTETDYTWQQAIKLYATGQKEQAMFMLGHILHLIEDTSVPDHTRNDPHPGDSPYEIYTSQFTQNNPDKNLNTQLNNKTPITLTDLDSYFDGLANYSNNNFYSKDTIGIQSGYNLPETDYFQIMQDGRSYGIHPDEDFGSYPIVMAKGLLEIKTDELLNRPIIMSNYWSRLSTKSVEYGAGVVNLFIQQAEAARNQNSNQTQSKSFLSQVIDAVSNFFSGIFGNNSQGFQPAGQISLDSQNNSQATDTNLNQTTQALITNPIAQTTSKPTTIQPQIDNQDENLEPPDQPTQNDQPDEQQTDDQQVIDDQQTPQTQTPSAQQCSFTMAQFPSHQGVIINEVAWMGSPTDANDEWIELKNVSNSDVNISNWQLLDQAEHIKINLASINGSIIIKPNQFILLERTDDNSILNITADLIYTGAISNTNEGLRLFDSQCSLIDEALTNPNGSTSSPQGWPAGDNASAAERKTMERDSSGFNWHTSSVIAGTPKKENSTPAASYGGGTSGSQTPAPNNTQQQTSSTNSNQVKILINEIQVSPTADRFIKLYNPNDLAVNLTNYYIQRKTQTGTSFGSLVSKTYFENKTIPAHGFFLISRSAVDGADIILDNLTLTESNAIQIKNSDGVVIDKVGWGQASDCESACAVQPGENQSIRRKSQNNSFVDTDNNLQDFELQTSQTNQALSAFFVSSISNNVVISEIYPDKTGNNYDFIELYNPTDSIIDLSNYSLRILKENTTSSELLANFSGETNLQIPAKGFFLIGFDNYNQSTSTLADVLRVSKSLPSTKSATIILQNDNDIIDEALYDPDSLFYNQSYERKSFYSGQCGPAQDEGEFLGNGCFDASFDVRPAQNPQNSLSLPEPRLAPTQPQNFNIIYNSSAVTLNLSWLASQDFNSPTSSVAYEITNKLTTYDVVKFKTTSTEAQIPITEIGRDYEFSIQALDKDGLGSQTATSTISVPSFLTNLYFYQDPKDATKNLIEAYYNQYPIAPELFNQNKWQLIIFYTNNSTSTFPVEYIQCSGGGLATRDSLPLPNSQDYCGTQGGAYNSAFDFKQLEDNHFIIKTIVSSDFITAAFYTTQSVQTMDGTAPNFSLIAMDKTKYYFGQLPTHQPPQLNSSINLDFDNQNSRLNIDWPKATDSDTLDNLLIYEIKYHDSDDWQLINNATEISKLVSPDDNFSISVRAKDNFDNYSNILTANWTYPATTFSITQTNITGWSSNFGYKDWNNNAYLNAQSITLQNDFQFNKIILKIKQAQVNDYANLKLSLYPDNNNFPDFSNELGSAVLSDILNPDENQDMTFSFNNPISVINNQKYWLILETQSYSGFNTWTQWDRNRWQNAISENNDYPDGGSGGITRNWDGTYSGFSENSAQDWYMKIGLGQ